MGVSADTLRQARRVVAGHERRTHRVGGWTEIMWCLDACEKAEASEETAESPAKARVDLCIVRRRTQPGREIGGRKAAPWMDEG